MCRTRADNGDVDVQAQSTLREWMQAGGVLELQDNRAVAEWLEQHADKLKGKTAALKRAYQLGLVEGLQGLDGDSAMAGILHLVEAMSPQQREQIAQLLRT